MHTLAEHKKTLRETLLKKRLAIHTMDTFSQAASQYIMAEPIWQSARIVALYLAARGEMDTTALAAAVHDQGKTLWLPRCAAQEPGCLHFVNCGPDSILCAGRFGLTEPHPGLEPLPDALAPDILMVPAIAYDQQGYRLGYGGGYYDRLLARPGWQKVVCIGLVPSALVLPHLPREPWDRPVHALASERGFQWL